MSRPARTIARSPRFDQLPDPLGFVGAHKMSTSPGFAPTLAWVPRNARRKLRTRKPWSSPRIWPLTVAVETSTPCCSSKASRCSSRVRSGLFLGRQPLFEQRALAGGRIRDRPGLHSSRLAPPFEPTLDGRQRHQKDLCYFLPGLATIDRVQHLQSQIFRLRSHAENLLRGSIANQVAVEAQRTYLGDQHPEPFHAYFKVSRETARAPHDGFNNLSEVGRL